MVRGKETNLIATKAKHLHSKELQRAETVNGVQNATRVRVNGLPLTTLPTTVTTSTRKVSKAKQPTRKQTWWTAPADHSRCSWLPRAETCCLICSHHASTAGTDISQPNDSDDDLLTQDSVSICILDLSVQVHLHLHHLTIQNQTGTITEVSNR